MGSNVASSVSQHAGAPGVQRTGRHYYKYTADLCALEGVAKSLRPSHQVDSRLRPVTTPLKVNEWARLLTNQVDTAFETTSWQVLKKVSASATSIVVSFSSSLVGFLGFHSHMQKLI